MTKSLTEESLGNLTTKLRQANNDFADNLSRRNREDASRSTRFMAARIFSSPIRPRVWAHWRAARWISLRPIF